MVVKTTSEKSQQSFAGLPGGAKRRTSLQLGQQ